MRSRDALAEAASISIRSVAKLEAPVGEPPVGASVLEAVARALPGWTVDTPRLILDGGPAPNPEGVPEHPSPAVTEIDTEQAWTEQDEQRYRLLRDMLRSQGLEMTPRALRIMKEEFDRLEAESRSEDQATQGDRP
jgi:hypothetical protein